MNVRDELLRAMVYAAFDEREANGGKVSRETAERIVHVHAIAPLIQLEAAIERAEHRLERGRDWDRESLVLMRWTGDVLERARAARIVRRRAA